MCESTSTVKNRHIHSYTNTKQTQSQTYISRIQTPNNHIQPNHTRLCSPSQTILFWFVWGIWVANIDKQLKFQQPKSYLRLDSSPPPRLLFSLPSKDESKITNPEGTTPTWAMLKCARLMWRDLVSEDVRDWGQRLIIREMKKRRKHDKVENILRTLIKRRWLWTQPFWKNCCSW